jgi:hypothetical protein
MQIYVRTYFLEQLSIVDQSIPLIILIIETQSQIRDKK